MKAYLRKAGTGAVFTLIELLVVVAIIAILAAMLLPALTRAREQARRVVCLANLKNVGLAAFSFADEQGDWFPRMGSADVRGHQSRPMVITTNYSRDTTWTLASQCGGAKTEFDHDPSINAPAWRGHGTSWSTWEEYGLVIELLDCPSSPISPVHANEDGSSYGWGGIGERWVTDYIITSGITFDGKDPHKVPGRCYSSNAQWRFHDHAEPAMSQRDNNADKRLIATDRVELHPGNVTYSTHAARNSIPPYQSLLYADGHVEGKREYRRPLVLGEQSFQNDGAGNPDVGTDRYKYQYWGQDN